MKELGKYNEKIVRFVGSVQNILDQQYISTIIRGKNISNGNLMILSIFYK